MHGTPTAKSNLGVRGSSWEWERGQGNEQEGFVIAFACINGQDYSRGYFVFHRLIAFAQPCASLGDDFGYKIHLFAIERMFQRVEVLSQLPGHSILRISPGQRQSRSRGPES